MAYSGDILGIASAAQDRRLRYTQPARLLPKPEEPGLDELRNLVAIERGLRNDAERRIQDLKAENERLITALGEMRAAAVVTPMERAGRIPTIDEVKEAFLIA